MDNPYNPTVMWRNYILSFLIFVLGFEIGASGDLLFKRMLLSEDERIELINMVEQHDTPSPFVNKDGPVAIEFQGIEADPFETLAIYKVTNYGTETVHFAWLGYAPKYYCELRTSPSPHHWIMGGSRECSAEVGSLQPFESTTVSVPVFYDNYGLWLKLYYTIGTSQETKEVNMITNTLTKSEIVRSPR
jgi:hypothetical protein